MDISLQEMDIQGIAGLPGFDFIMLVSWRVDFGLSPLPVSSSVCWLEVKRNLPIKSWSDDPSGNFGGHPKNGDWVPRGPGYTSLVKLRWLKNSTSLDATAVSMLVPRSDE